MQQQQQQQKLPENGMQKPRGWPRFIAHKQKVNGNVEPRPQQKQKENPKQGGFTANKIHINNVISPFQTTTTKINEKKRRKENNNSSIPKLSAFWKYFSLQVTLSPGHARTLQVFRLSGARLAS